MPDSKQPMPSGGDIPELSTPFSFRTEVSGSVYSYASYTQYWRGLKSVGTQTASGLFGNGTNLASKVNVIAGDSLTISGRWFNPGAVYIRWDGTAVVGTVTGNQWRDAVILNSTIADASGSFAMKVTIPNANGGEHYLAVEDSQTIVIVKVLLSPGSLQISPSSGPGGANVQFTGSGYPASSRVDLSYLDPYYGSRDFLRYINTYLSGRIKLR